MRWHAHISEELCAQLVQLQTGVTCCILTHKTFLIVKIGEPVEQLGANLSSSPSPNLHSALCPRCCPHTVIIVSCF
jgi:hypothetical protein